MGPNYVLEQTHAADAKQRSANWWTCTQKDKAIQDLVCCENQDKSLKKKLKGCPRGQVLRWCSPREGPSTCTFDASAALAPT